MNNLKLNRLEPSVIEGTSILFVGSPPLAQGAVCAH
jgi:hypothetical protein